ncbi:DMT family transporter [Cognatishimia sp. SS12]|nr:DMT family transporter [Cognatishimia sp. SS12]MDC0738176.1 DMT family transporter [Cognatishimia sp. SS12]
MRLFLLTSLTMLAFAANSVLNRLALTEVGMDAVLFAIIRLVTGALALGALLLLRGKPVVFGGRRRWVGSLALLLYLFGFSLAYVRLDAGVGALLLFGTVQITMFIAAVLGGEALPRARWVGASVAFAGLLWLLWPTETAAHSPVHLLAMIAAGVGWGLYSLAGRQEPDATGGTALNFLCAVPLGLLLLPFAALGTVTAYGAALAALSGIVTSGLGYALWYAVLPALGASRAAVIQLTVPVLATLGGLVLLAEPVTARLIVATLLVLAGVTYALRRATP